MKNSMRFLTFSIDFQFWTKRSRASRLSVLVIFEGEVRRKSGKSVGGSAGGREPGGGERGGTLPTFKEKKSLERRSEGMGGVDGGKRT